VLESFAVCLRAKEFLHLHTKANEKELKTTTTATGLMTNEDVNKIIYLTMFVLMCVSVCVCTRGKSVNKLSLEERWAEEALENHSAIEEPTRNSWRLAGHNEAKRREVKGEEERRDKARRDDR